MSIDNLLGMLAYLAATELKKDNWVILILNENIEDGWITSLIKEAIELKDIPIKGKNSFVIVDVFGDEIEIMENWDLTEDEIKKFLELINLHECVYDVRKGILMVYYEKHKKEVMTEALLQFTKYLIKNRYGKE